MILKSPACSNVASMPTNQPGSILLRQAVAAYTTATQVDAAFAAAYRELAITYTKLGDSDGAAATRHPFIALHGEMSFLPLPTENSVATRDLPLVTPGLKEPRP
jgi:hypothetical protein